MGNQSHSICVNRTAEYLPLCIVLKSDPSFHFLASSYFLFLSQESDENKISLNLKSEQREATLNGWLTLISVIKVNAKVKKDKKAKNSEGLQRTVTAARPHASLPTPSHALQTQQRLTLSGVCFYSSKEYVYVSSRRNLSGVKKKSKR